MAARKKHPGAVAVGRPSTVEQIMIDIPDATMNPVARVVPRESIYPDPQQPRQEPDAALRESIARNGLIQPITVRPHPERMGDWMIVDGERRWRGSEGILTELPVIVREDMEDVVRRVTTQLVANTGKPLTPLEEARSFKRILDETHMPLAQLAELLGRPRSTVSERLSLLELEAWLPLLDAGTLQVTHAFKHLLPLRGIPTKFHEQVLEKLLNDYRWEKGDISGAKFGSAIREFFDPFMYPLKKVAKSGYGEPKNPLFDTKDHDELCPCGGIKWDRHGNAGRLSCGNPDYWRARDRKAKAERKKNAPTTPGNAQPSLYLPDGHVIVTAQHYHDAPDDAVMLSDHYFKWVTGGRYSAGKQLQRVANATGHVLPFDPRDVVIDPGQLVLVRGGGALPRVGTRDLGAVEAAQAHWRIRFARRATDLRAAAAKELEKHEAIGHVAGAGVGKILNALAGKFAPSLVDLAEILTIAVPDFSACAPHDRMATTVAWLNRLHPSKAEVLLTAFATAAARNLKLPTATVEEEQRNELNAISKQKVPWTRKGGRKVFGVIPKIPLDNITTETVEMFEGDEDGDDQLWDAPGDEEIEAGVGADGDDDE